jgi:lysozyme
MSRAITANCTALVRHFEGCKLAAYPDPGTGGSPWTIGWGATGAGIRKGVVWTQAQADARLATDFAKKAADVSAIIGSAPTTANQFDALCSFAYNCGLGDLRSSTLLKKHLAGHFTEAAAEFGKWNKAAGHVLPGLTKRRAAEAALYGAPDGTADIQRIIKIAGDAK